MRKNISTNTPSEKFVGYSRAVRVRNTIYISGTTSQNEKGEIIGNTVGGQTKFIIKKIKSVLENENFSLNDIVETTVYLVDLKNLKDFDKVFKKYFYSINPTCTLVGINSLVDEKLLIEISATAQKEKDECCGECY
ncbi:RidA family protein [Candidatus Gottesmanbacteria bacterium]|nr:RidA family protein [Candidatus Gottesmanbacteria bacterium]